MTRKLVGGYMVALFLSMPLLCIGTPFLIVSIVGTVKSNRRINALRAQTGYYNA